MINQTRRTAYTIAIVSPLFSLLDYSFGGPVRKNTHIITNNKELIYYFGAQRKHAEESRSFVEQQGWPEIPLPRCVSGHSKAAMCMSTVVLRWLTTDCLPTDFIAL